MRAAGARIFRAAGPRLDELAQVRAELARVTRQRDDAREERDEARAEVRRYRTGWLEAIERQAAALPVAAGRTAP